MSNEAETAVGSIAHLDDVALRREYKGVLKEIMRHLADRTVKAAHAAMQEGEYNAALLKAAKAAGVAEVEK